ncbi:hypothetical protein FACS189419_08150 [Planctomycetales bacterium]|nr:hypothetical protein FACS189419_08150 [Planctomycetales bacterium]
MTNESKTEKESKLFYVLPPLAVVFLCWMIFLPILFPQKNFLEVSDVELGDIAPGSKVSFSVQLNNTGKEIILDSIATSCGCVSGNRELKTLKQGINELNFTYSASDVPGKVSQSIGIFAKEGTPNFWKVNMHGNVAAKTWAVPRQVRFGLGIDRQLRDEQLTVFYPKHKIRSIQRNPSSITCEKSSEGAGQTTFRVSYNGEIQNSLQGTENLGSITIEFEGETENNLQVPVSLCSLPLLSPLPESVLLSETKKDSQGLVTEKVAVKILDKTFTGKIRADVLEPWVTLTDVKEGTPYSFFTFQFCLKEIPAGREISFVNFVPEMADDAQHRDITVKCVYQK